MGPCLSAAVDPVVTQDEMRRRREKLIEFREKVKKVLVITC